MKLKREIGITLAINFIVWRLALMREILRICRSKTEFKEYEFGRREQDINGTKRGMSIGRNVVSEVEHF